MCKGLIDAIQREENKINKPVIKTVAPPVIIPKKDAPVQQVSKPIPKKSKFSGLEE